MAIDPDDRLRDEPLLAEIELLCDVIIAATASNDRLTPAQIDLMLGVVPASAAMARVPEQVIRDLAEPASSYRNGIS